MGRPAPGKRGHLAGQRNKLEKHVADAGSSNLHGGLARTNRLSRSDDAMLSGHTFVAVAVAVVAGPMPALVPSTVPGGQADGVSDVAVTSVAVLRNESLVRWMCRASKSAAACWSRASTASSSCWCS